MLEQLQSSDWSHVFDEGRMELAFPDSVVSDARPTREDVVSIVKIQEDDSEGYGAWSGKLCGRLKDGRWLVAEGWCDTSGWG